MKIKHLIVFLMIVVFTGCANKNAIMKSAFDINNEYSVKTSFINTSQIRQMSVNGLSPINNVGEIYFLHPSRGAQNSVMLDPVGTDLAEQVFKTQIIEYEAGENATLNNLFIVKDLISLLEFYSNKIVENKVKVLLEETKKIVIQKDSILSQAANGLNNVEPKITVQSDDKNTISNVSKIVGAVNNNKNTKITDANKDSCITAAYTKNEALSNDKPAYNKSMYNSLHLCYIQKTRLANIIVFKWNTNSEVGAEIDATEFAALHAKNKKETSGYVIASGITVEKLIPSFDYVKNLENSFSTSWVSGRVGVVTYTLKVKNLVTFSSQKNESMFKLLASFNNVQQFSTDIKNLLKVGIGISAISALDISSFSQLSTQKVSYRNYKYNEKVALKDTVKSSVKIIKKTKSSTKETTKNDKRDIIKEIKSDKIRYIYGDEQDSESKTIFNVITEAVNLSNLFKPKTN